MRFVDMTSLPSCERTNRHVLWLVELKEIIIKFCAIIGSSNDGPDGFWSSLGGVHRLWDVLAYEFMRTLWRGATRGGRKEESRQAEGGGMGTRFLKTQSLVRSFF